MAETKLYRDKNLQIIFGVTLMVVIGVVSITPAFPKIVEELQISRTQVGMLITVFAFPGIALAPVIGILADRFGRKKILVPSLVLFGLASGACALTRDFTLLIAFRVVQGTGAAALSSLNMTIISDLYSGRRRVEAMGLNASVLSIGTASFPLIGGALAMLAWNYPFLLSLSAIPIGILVLFCLQSPEPKSNQDLRTHLGSTWRYLKSMKVISAFVSGTIIFLILYGPYLTYFSLLLGTSFQAQPFIIGLIMSAMSVTTAITSSQLGRLVKLARVTTLVNLGFFLSAIVMALIPLMPGLAFLLLPVFIFGISHGITMPSMMTYIAELAPAEHRAAFMSINTTMLRVGQTLGPVLFGLAYTWAGFEGVFFSAAGLAMVTAITTFVGGRIVR